VLAYEDALLKIVYLDKMLSKAYSVASTTFAVGSQGSLDVVGLNRFVADGSQCRNFVSPNPILLEEERLL
jgi:hypothetical protein